MAARYIISLAVTNIDLKNLSFDELLELSDLATAKFDAARYNNWLSFYPDNGPRARHLYPKHVDFMNASATFNQLAFMAGNQIGKSTTGAYMVARWATGDYPDWWRGRKFDGPVNILVAGDTNQTTRDTIQRLLLGDVLDIGSGMIPKSKIKKVYARVGGVQGAIERVTVSHPLGTSTITFKSYDQKRKAFQGTTNHVAWLDEEPKDQGIYSEIITRTATTGGLVICTFTPLNGLSDVALSFLPDGMMPEDGVVNDYKYVTMAGWEDVPEGHFPPGKKEELLASYAPHEMEARTKGIPCIGTGKVYPIEESAIIVEPFAIPREWPKMYAMDVGYKMTAAVFGALDPNSDVLYIYDEYYRGLVVEPAIHIAAIKARGDWMYGAIDYAGGGVVEGERLGTVEQYTKLGLKVFPANKNKETGTQAVWRRMCEGRFKILSNCQNLIKELRMLRRDDKGEIIKGNDHECDCIRYLVMGLNAMRTEPDPDYEFLHGRKVKTTPDRQGSSDITGY